MQKLSYKNSHGILTVDVQFWLIKIDLCRAKLIKQEIYQKN